MPNLFHRNERPDVRGDAEVRQLQRRQGRILRERWEERDRGGWRRSWRSRRSRLEVVPFFWRVWLQEWKGECL